jgi:hypothetical protein
MMRVITLAVVFSSIVGLGLAQTSSYTSGEASPTATSSSAAKTYTVGILSFRTAVFLSRTLFLCFFNVEVFLGHSKWPAFFYVLPTPLGQEILTPRAL